MAIFRSDPIIWHDLRIAPDDLPDEEDKVLVTIENYEGDRRVAANVYLRPMEDDEYAWCTLSINAKTGRMDEIMVWEEVVAWAEYPAPHVETI